MNKVKGIVNRLAPVLLLALSVAFGRAAKADQVGPVGLETFEAVWKKVYEHHFDTNYNGHNWLKVRDEFQPRAADARNTRELREVLQQMIDLLHVSHMAIVPGDLSELIDTKRQMDTAAVEQADEEDSGRVGMEVRFVGTNLVVTRVEAGLPAQMAGVKPGWVISRIGGRATKDLFPERLHSLDEQRRRFLAWRAAARKLSGAPGSKVELEVLDRNNMSRLMMLKRVESDGEAVQFGSLPVIFSHFEAEALESPQRRRVGVIRFDIWMLPTAIQFNKAIDQFRDRDGIVIDLRGNIGGMVGMIIGTAGHFLTKPVNLGALVARDNTFQLPANPRFVSSSGKPVTPYAGPVAILVDEITASASEVFAGAMQELGRVRVFGRRSSGQALPAIMDDLPNGDIFYHPISDFVTAKGTRFEGRGVIPDQELPLERSALLAGTDRDLTEALVWIDAQAASRQ